MQPTGGAQWEQCSEGDGASGRGGLELVVEAGLRVCVCVCVCVCNLQLGSKKGVEGRGLAG